MLKSSTDFLQAATKEYVWTNEKRSMRNMQRLQASEMVHIRQSGHTVQLLHKH